MAIPPTIPTSFVPKQPVEMHPRHSESDGNMFMVSAGAILGIALILAGAVFAYDRYLLSQVAEKEQQLEAAQAGVSEETVDGFIRLRNRFTTSTQVLNQHVMLSQFFDSLESLTLQTVRFSTLDIKLAEDHSAEVNLEGIAKNFNALAAQSAAFASERRIKQAIFSDIAADDNGVVTFKVVAKLDPAFVNMPGSVPESWSPAPAATSTPEAPATQAAPTVTPTAPPVQTL